MKNTLIFIAIIILLIAGIYVAGRRGTSSVPQEQLEAFAQCIASKDLTMYGAAWCSHCQKEKALFGAAFQFVPYVECPENQKLCLDKGMDGYPTWIDADGAKYPGEQGLEKLAEISGCTL